MDDSFMKAKNNLLELEIKNLEKDVSDLKKMNLELEAEFMGLDDEMGDLEYEVCELRDSEKAMSDRLEWTVEDNAKKAVELADLRKNMGERIRELERQCDTFQDQLYVQWDEE